MPVDKFERMSDAKTRDTGCHSLILIIICYVHTQFYLALYMCVFIFPVAIFRTGFPFV